MSKRFDSLCTCTALGLSVVTVAIMFIRKTEFTNSLLSCSISVAILFSIVGGSRRVFCASVYGLSVFGIFLAIRCYRAIAQRATFDMDDLAALPLIFLLSAILPICITWIVHRCIRCFAHKVQTEI